MDLEILGRGFLTTASSLLISQLSLMVTIYKFLPSIDLEKFYGQLIKNFEMEGVSLKPQKPPKTAPAVTINVNVNILKTLLIALNDMHKVLQSYPDI